VTDTLYTFRDDNYSFQYKIIQKRSIKHSYIRITKSGIVVTANKTNTLKYLHGFVASKRDWIAKHLNKSDIEPSYNLTLTDAKVYLLGKAYGVSITIDTQLQHESMSISENIAQFMLSQEPTHDRLLLLRDEYYKSLCHSTITPIVEEQSQIMNLYPSKIGYRRTKSRWGSCSTKNSISLNTRLMMLPLTLIRYIVIHELAHIQEKNHSRDFWAIVERYYPNYKEKKKLIRWYEKLF